MAGASVAIDWGSLDDDFAEVVVVPSSASASASASATTFTPTCSGTPEIAAMSDHNLREKIQRLRGLLKDTTLFSDRGEKLRINLTQYQDELRKRETTSFPKDDGAKEKNSHSTTRESPYCRSDPTFSFKKSYGSCRTPLSVNNFYGKEKVAFESELILLGRDKCKTMEKGKDIQASREPPSRSFSERGHSREKGKGQKSSRKVPSRSVSDRIRKRVCSDGYNDLSAHLFSKSRRKVSKSEDPLDSDSEKVTNVVLLDDDDLETPEQICYLVSRNDPEAIELGYSDMKCLEPCEYLSSPVMNFYIQFLKQSLCQTSRSIRNFYIFNTYFYQKLEEAFDGEDAQNSLFVKLRRWWKGVNIFEKAYIILPIHGRLHWSLVIICIPEERRNSGPIKIIHLDSLGCHSSNSIFNTIERVYLSQPSNFWIMFGKVPQQENEYDCGLFVLYFIERFIIDAPDRFTNDDLAMFGRKWFKPEEASSLRQRIRNLLIKELKSVQIENPTKDLEAVSCSSDSE
ncbi:Ubiquitin-like-specific protease 1D [Carex littledalei]|uniref:Ubiquitin-like-specific protease 1D n=1 Tax=Carex littledalei TaxID=544730 RepID=A0A833RGC2_9POAL|nr:Ubiquitin-like-specific protease 1D [Carex littledalei]